MNHDPIVPLPGTKNLWDELNHVHISQSNWVHFVGHFLP